ncbi:MAG: type II toxin-antitoxin system HicB family antitoxin [Candidatus Korobacteraceae bacterium]
MAKGKRSPDHPVSPKNGEMKRERGDTLVGTLRKTYGDDFAKGYRADTRLKSVLKKEGGGSLSGYLRKKRAISVRTYTAVVHREGRWYVAECPEVGVVSQGTSIEEAVSNLKEATELYLEEFPPPPPQRAVITTFDVSYA